MKNQHSTANLKVTRYSKKDDRHYCSDPFEPGNTEECEHQYECVIVHQPGGTHHQDPTPREDCDVIQEDYDDIIHHDQSWGTHCQDQTPTEEYDDIKPHQSIACKNKHSTNDHEDYVITHLTQEEYSTVGVKPCHEVYAYRPPTARYPPL